MALFVLANLRVNKMCLLLMPVLLAVALPVVGAVEDARLEFRDTVQELTQLNGAALLETSDETLWMQVALIRLDLQFDAPVFRGDAVFDLLATSKLEVKLVTTERADFVSLLQRLAELPWVDDGADDCIGRLRLRLVMSGKVKLELFLNPAMSVVCFGGTWQKVDGEVLREISEMILQILNGELEVIDKRIGACSGVNRTEPNQTVTQRGQLARERPISRA
jgi:hypothetical protein